MSAHATASDDTMTALTASAVAAVLSLANWLAPSAPSPVSSRPMAVIVVTARPVAASILAMDWAGVSCLARSAHARSAGEGGRTAGSTVAAG